MEHVPIYVDKKKEGERMEKYFNNISIITSFAGGFLASLFGGWDILLKTILFLAVMDYVTGWIKGIYEKNLSSEIGFRGILKKIVMFIVIAAAYNIQTLISSNIPVREVVIMFYIANEGLSLLENAAIFVPIPERLKDILLQLRDKNTENKEN